MPGPGTNEYFILPSIVLFVCASVCNLGIGAEKSNEYKRKPSTSIMHKVFGAGPRMNVPDRPDLEPAA